MSAKESENLNNKPQLWRKLTADKFLELFAILQRHKFTGKLKLIDEQNQIWIFYWSAGTLTYGTGGHYYQSRWQRSLTKLDLKEPESTVDNKSEIADFEYRFLAFSFEENKINYQQLVKIVNSNILEVLFELLQTEKVTYELDRQEVTRIVLVNANQVLTRANQLVQAWQENKLTNLSPNLLPIITQIQAKELSTVKPNFLKLLDGEHNFWDLAEISQQDLVKVIKYCLKYVKLGLIKLVDPTDLADSGQENDNYKPLVACVDDSPLVCHILEDILLNNNYRFIGINNPEEAILTLSSCRPDFIFLDVIMPKIDGYTLCQQLRKIDYFHYLPIVILTGQDGIVDRVKARFVGASAFLSKPVETEKLLKMLARYLPHTGEQKNTMSYRGRPISY